MRALSMKLLAGRSPTASSFSTAKKAPHARRIIPSYGKINRSDCPNRRLFEFSCDSFRTGNKAETLADVVYRCSQAIVRRCCRRTVFDQKTVIAEKIGALERAQHALIGV